jgi:hypothetical protein
MWDGTLLLGEYMVTYLGPGGPAGWHAHHAVSSPSRGTRR